MCLNAFERIEKRWEDYLVDSLDGSLIGWVLSVLVVGMLLFPFMMVVKLMGVVCRFTRKEQDNG